jgi:hypothetical protein
LPDGWKQALKSDIQALDDSLNFISIDCHRHESNGKAVIHVAIDGSAILAS